MNIKNRTYKSNGKLLITAEYLVLDGAKALAVPTKFGQSLTITKTNSKKLSWKSYNEKKAVWFSTEFILSSTNHLKSINDGEVSARLLKIINAAKDLNPKFLNDTRGLEIETHLDFPQNWGLGTSSTLITNIANWAGVDAYKLLGKTFGGSGYDIACASHDKSLMYQLLNDETRNVSKVNFNPVFNKNIYFVHLNKKQNSREGIAQYRANTSDKSDLILQINKITTAMIDCKSLSEFQYLMDLHERLISEVIQQKPVKVNLFEDFEGSIKSLGAWGGDFVMVAAKENPTDYFKSKGYGTILDFESMVLNSD